MSVKRSSILIAALLAAAGLTAQEANTSKLEKSLSFGATLTDGNSETMLLNGSLLIEGEQERLGSFKTGAEANYGENTVRRTVTDSDGSEVKVKEDEKSVYNAKAFANLRKTLSPLTYAYLNGDLLYDDIAEIDYRATLGPGLGAYLLKDDTVTLSVEAGVAYLWEKVVDIKDDYLALRFAQAFEYKFSENAKIWQSIEYLPEASHFSNYLINAELGAEAPLNGKVNLRLVLQDKYDSEPGAGMKRNDLTLLAGLSIKL